MEYQLQDLIDRIKKDGFEASETAARDKILQARDEAQKILDQARTEADQMLAEARKEADRMAASGRDALRQAARDISLTLEQDLKNLLRNLLAEALGAEYRPEVIEEAILAVAASWAGLVPGSRVVVSPALESALLGSLKGRLADLAKKGLTVKASPKVRAGFRLEEADGSAYWDFGPETMARALAEFVNPGLALILGSKE